MSVEHVLKCWPNYFDAVERGEKTFEVRKDDRGFQKGDIVRLQKWSRDLGYIPPPGASRFADAAESVHLITYVLTGGQFGIEPGYVVLALAPPSPTEPPRGG